MLNIPLEEISEICRKYKVKELSLFGSSLREDFNKDSDIDLLYTFEDNSENTLFDLVNIKTEFEKIFGRPVDFISRKAMERSKNSIRRNSILSNSKVIYGS